MSAIVDVVEAVYSVLAAPGFVRTLTHDRIYPGQAPSQIDTDESIIFYVSGTENDDTSMTSSGDRSDVTTMTFLCLGGPMGKEGYFRARRLAKALKKEIHGLTGTFGSVRFQSCERINNEDTYDERVKRFAVVETYEIRASYS